MPERGFRQVQGSCHLADRGMAGTVPGVPKPFDFLPQGEVNLAPFYGTLLHVSLLVRVWESRNGTARG